MDLTVVVYIEYEVLLTPVRGMSVNCVKLENASLHYRAVVLRK